MPRRAYTPPSVIASVLFVILSFIILFFFGIAYMGVFFVASFSWWYIPLWLFTSYHFGLAIAKSNRKNPKLTHLKIIGMESLMIIAQLLALILIYGYPIKLICASTCLITSIFGIILFLIIESIISFIPAYCAIFKYSKWRKIIEQKEGS